MGISIDAYRICIGMYNSGRKILCMLNQPSEQNDRQRTESSMINTIAIFLLLLMVNLMVITLSAHLGTSIRQSLIVTGKQQCILSNNFTIVNYYTYDMSCVAKHLLNWLIILMFFRPYSKNNDLCPHYVFKKILKQKYGVGHKSTFQKLYTNHYC